MKGLFWVSMAFVMYTYVGYPLVLWLLVKRRSRDVVGSEIVPTVSIIIAARNEADKIQRKLDHTLALKYPTERLEIIVASDASDDGTDEIVKAYAARGVRLVRAPQRNGKEYVQGLAVSVALGDVIVFTDSAAILEPEALRSLVQNFADPTIGAVSTEDCLVDAAGNPTGEGLYVKYEMWVRRLESRFHSIVGLSGSCFAIRRELCTPWPSNLASDFRSALQTARGGYRSIADASARARFVAVASTKAEMRRRIRTFLRGITVLMAHVDLLNPLRHGRFAFQLASHKLLRFLAPILLLIALIASGVGALSGDRLLFALFVMQVAFYGAGYVSGVAPLLQRLPLVRVAHFFTMVQCAMLVAWVRYARGEEVVTWEPSRRKALTPDDGRLTVCHVFSGDLWAGAEVVIFNLLSSLQQEAGLRLVAVALNEGTLTERLRAAGVTTYVIPESRHSLPGILWRAARLLRAERVGVIHSHRYKENLLAWLLAKRLGIPETVTTMHGLPEAPGNRGARIQSAGWRRRLDHVIVRNLFSTTVAVSDEMKRALIDRYGFREERIRVIRNGGQFPDGAAVAASPNEIFHIGTVGRMVPIKGLDLFLEVAAALRQDSRAVRFSILGDGPLRDELARKAEDLKISDSVEFVAPRPDPFGYYRSLDVYLSTSVHEGLPLSVVEAMACGKPVVSSAVGGIPEIVVDGEDGFLVKGRDPQQFAERCRALMRDARLRSKMGERAAASAHTRLSAATMAQAYRRLYEKSGAGRPRGAADSATAMLPLPRANGRPQ